ncbi:MAG: phosphoribosylamine--glycine ligase [Bryobacterales bacterium]|nr:phosphoribosylamine--glycine ligase [Bryobacterales bacterium]
MKLLVLGSGGREHAMAWRLARSASVEKVFAAPGNPGIAQVAECVTPSGNTPGDYLALAEAAGADLTVVGPEAPLVAGVVDAFRAAGRKIFGPTQAAAQLEGSKVFAKRFFDRAGIPTAAYTVAEDAETALRAIQRFSFPLVLKADGLAAGKGVLIVEDRHAAETGIRGLFSGDLVGTAGSRVVIEEYLRGDEVSFIALCDGRDAFPLEPTQDHKAVFDGDSGPNTGGMGAYCDSRILTGAQTTRVLNTVIYPTLECMAADGAPFTGFLYAGLMMTADGPKVLEFNVRLGDPETQALLHRLDDDFGALLEAATQGQLRSTRLNWSPDPSVCLVLAAHGYPGKVRTGDPISGIQRAEETGATVFQAGTKLTPAGLATAGGRVLGVTASGPTLANAIHSAYRAAAEVHFDGKHYRTDIGRKGLRRW